jgi:sulfatase maturation enzyme AslB (radical SAM superfamily)
MKDFRLKMLNGEIPESCKRCVATEELSGESRRLIENREYAGEISDLVSNTKDNGEIEQDIVIADYRLGNICNLQCRMCTPKTSKLWIKDFNKMKVGLQDFEIEHTLEELEKLNWYDEGVLVSEFKQKVKTLKRLHFGGGEPLVAPKMLELLKVCVEEKCAEKITLSYNTNITKLPSEILNLWGEFKEIKLLVSIDAVEELNDYIRYPSKWVNIDKNLRYLDENYKKFNITEILINTTVQINNVYHLDKLFDYLSDFNFVKKVPNLINLFFPVYMRTAVLPNKIKKQAFLKLKEIRSKAENSIDPSDEYLLQNIDQCCNYLISSMDKKFIDTFWHEFEVFTSKYDQEKSLSLIAVNPELSLYFKKNK